MTTPIIISTVENRRKVLNAIIDLDLNGKQWEVAIKRHRKRRSTKQSNMYWMWIDEITPYVSEATGYEKDEIHKIFKQNFLPAIKMEMGGLTAEGWSTKDLNTKEMSDYCNRIHRWAAGFGIVLPLPPERGYDGDGHAVDAKQAVPANGADDDWNATVSDIVEQIERATCAGDLEEMGAVHYRTLRNMQNHAPEHYTTVTDAVKLKAENLNRVPG